jgi:hypothetical protein
MSFPGLAMEGAEGFPGMSEDAVTGGGAILGSTIGVPDVDPGLGVGGFIGSWGPRKKEYRTNTATDRAKAKITFLSIIISIGSGSIS